MIILLIVLKLIIVIHTAKTTNNNSLLNVYRNQLKLIEGSMDPTTDPCENFYQYACGNWDKMHPNKSIYENYYELIEYNTNKEMASLLTADEKTMHTTNRAKDEPKFVTTVRAYYRSCEAVRQVELVEYFKWLEATEHINMMLTDSNPKSVNTSIELDWLKHLAVMNKYGLSGLFLDETYLNSSGFLKIAKPLNESGFEKLTLEQFEYIAYRLTPTGSAINNNVDINWSDFSNFEEDLMNFLFAAKGTSASFTMSTLSELPWLYRYVSMLLQNTRFPGRKIDVQILIEDIVYVRKLYDLLQQYTQQFLCEYLKIRFSWHLLIQSAKITPESCALKARQYMYLATDYLFERQNVDIVQNIPKIHTMFSNIKDQYKKILLTNPNGFNSTVMQFLLDKLNSTQLKVGLLPRSNTRETLEMVYSSLNLNGSGAESFYGNHMEVLKFKTNVTHLKLIRMFEDPSKYLEHTKIISPYYIILWNIIVLPITTLQLPLYHSDLPNFFLYSSLGFVIGHELSHSFDTAGIQRDPKGRISEIYHPFITANKRYQRNLACLNRLTRGDVDEKIADVTGFRVAFQTYFNRYPTIRPKSVFVNGMKLTVDKMFFLNYAQFSCSTSKETSYEDVAHGPHEDRIIDALSHFPEFVKTFKCPTYTDMHVQQHCQLWR